MIESRQSHLHLPAEIDAEALNEALAPAFTLRAGESASEALTFFDTWEWTLWYNQRLLFTRGDELHLATSVNGWPGTTELTADLQTPMPRFVWDFADPRIRKVLTKTTGLRALSEIARIRNTQRPVELLDENEKIVCRLRLTEMSTKNEAPFYHLVEVLPLRGYEKEAARAMELLEASGAEETLVGPLERLLELKGRKPEPYTLKPVFDLEPATPAREAVRKIVHRMLMIGRSNESGVLGDIDTEFLHDYRICIRKIRSVLSLVKGVYPPEETASLKKTLSELGGATNRLRDLDVYLLSRDEYTRLLPPALRPGLNGMFRDFSEERKGAFRKVRRHLRSPEYEARMQHLDGFFVEPDRLLVSPTSHLPIGPLVSRRIYKRYRTIRKINKSLTAATPDAVVHELRIDCKKLRYLLEFFSEIFPTGGMTQVQKQLRRLQNRLGNFNDYSVQQDALLKYWETKAKAGSRKMAMSLGGLVGVLYQEQCLERERIHEALDTFCSKDVHALFKELFTVDSADLPGPFALHETE